MSERKSSESDGFLISKAMIHLGVAVINGIERVALDERDDREIRPATAFIIGTAVAVSGSLLALKTLDAVTGYGTNPLNYFQALNQIS